MLPKQEASLQEVKEELELVKTKASGWPWRCFAGSTKGEVMRKYTLEELMQYYETFTPVISTTLKDEIRLQGKDARLFRPADISLYVQGARLFQKQNDYLLDLLFLSPIFAKYCTPGVDLAYLFRILKAHGGGCYAADGSQWDSHVPIGVISAIAWWREQRIRGSWDYYEKVYKGYSLVDGVVVPMDHQASGHYNTTVDNCLVNMCMMALCAHHMRWSLTKFTQQVRYFVCGDDLIWSDRSGKFTPKALANSSNRFNVFYEFESFEPKTASELHFCGVSFYDRCYSYNPDKIRASSEIHRKRMTPTEHLMKLASLTVNSFGNTQLYDEMRQKFDLCLEAYFHDGLIDEANQMVKSLKCCTSVSWNERAYNCLEGVFPFFESSVDCSNKYRFKVIMAAQTAMALGKALYPVIKPYAMKGIQAGFNNVMGSPGQARRAKRLQKRRRDRAVSNVYSSMPRNAPVNRGNTSSVNTGKTQIIAKRELLFDISTTSANAYDAAVFAVNPAESGSFPSLAVIAEQYQKASIKMLRFEYVPKCATSTTGSVAINVIADAQATKPATFEELAGACGARSSTAWMAMTFPVNLNNMIQIPGGNLVGAPLTPNNTSYDRFTTMGTAVVGWTGVPASTNIGSVYVHYIVQLSDPIARPTKPTHVSYYQNTTGAGAADFDFNTFTGITDVSSYFPNKHPVKITAGSTGFVRRYSGRLIVYAHVNAPGLFPSLTLTDNGVVVAPYVNHGSANSNTVVWVIPHGTPLSAIEVTPSVAWNSANVIVFAH